MQTHKLFKTASKTSQNSDESSKSADSPASPCQGVKVISKKVSAHIYSKNPEDPVDVIASDYVIEKKGLLKDEESCEKASTNPFLQAKLKYMLNQTSKQLGTKKTSAPGAGMDDIVVIDPTIISVREKVTKDNKTKEMVVLDYMAKIKLTHE